MTEADMQAVAKRNEDLVARLTKTAYPGCRSALDSALANIDYFVLPANLSLAGARHWVLQAQKELDQMHKALVAAEAVVSGG